MKFCVENDLSLFEFHDSVLSLVSFNDRDLVISASMVNIHKDTPQNPTQYDMEIASAQITFRNFHAVTYDPMISCETDDDGQTHTAGQRMVFDGQDAIDRILEELQNEIWVHYFGKKDHGYILCGCGIEPYFEIHFNFDHVVVYWDEYKKKAWYELHHQYKYDAVLHTPNGDETVKLQINYSEEPVYFGRSPQVSVGCIFEEKEYWGHGSEYLWTDALADLQRRLPEGIILKGCLTCRHGNFCPVGDSVNEVFCTRDVLIAQKSDLFFYTEDCAERDKRSKQYFDLCEDYQPQSEDFFTYNDYLYYLNGE